MPLSIHLFSFTLGWLFRRSMQFKLMTSLDSIWQRSRVSRHVAVWSDFQFVSDCSSIWPLHTRMHTHTYTYAHMYVCMQLTHTHTCAHARTCWHTHTQTHRSSHLQIHSSIKSPNCYLYRFLPLSPTTPILSCLVTHGKLSPSTLSRDCQILRERGQVVRQYLSRNLQVTMHI